MRHLKLINDRVSCIIAYPFLVLINFGMAHFEDRNLAVLTKEMHTFLGRIWNRHTSPPQRETGG